MEIKNNPITGLFRKIFHFFSVQKPVLQVDALHSIALNRRVAITIFLPPAYEAGDGPLPLLCFNDGQDMQAVGLEATLNWLYSRKKIREIMVVAIYAGDRMQEYGTSKIPDYENRGSRASQYAEFIIKELLPYLQKKIQISTDASLNAFAGFSLGGLSAFDIAWNHPEKFGMAGIFSGALWWRSEAYKADDPDADRIIHEMVQKNKKQKDLKYWFQTGTKDETADRNNNGIIDSIDDTLDLIAMLEQSGSKRGKDIEYVEVQGGIHHPKTWKQVLPYFLIWAYGLK